jgi:hypothetical protein
VSTPEHVGPAVSVDRVARARAAVALDQVARSAAETRHVILEPQQPAGRGGHPGRPTEFLGEDVAPPVTATAAVLAEGQLRGEIMPDEPPESLAGVLLYAVLFGARRGATLAGLPVRRHRAAWPWPWPGGCAACAPKDTQLRRA